MSKNLSPQNKLMKAIFGSTKPSREQVEKVRDEYYARQAENETDEEFKKAVGMPKKEFLDKGMLHIGWCEALAKWSLEHYDDRKYHVLDFEPKFSFGQVTDLLQIFYRQGQHDARLGISEYNRLWKLNKLDVYVTEEPVVTPKYKVGDDLHGIDSPEDKITIVGVGDKYLVGANWADDLLDLPFNYVEKNYTL